MTRGLAIIPAAFIAAVAGEHGVGRLLLFSQVRALSESVEGRGLIWYLKVSLLSRVFVDLASILVASTRADEGIWRHEMPITIK